MKLKYTFEYVDMGDGIVAVPVGRDADRIHGVLKLNKEGREILNLLENEITEEKIVDTLALQYENTRDVLAGYVHKTIDVLRSDGLIDE